MTTTKVTDKAIATANKVFTLIDDVQLKTEAVETCAEEVKEDLIKESNKLAAQWEVVAQSALKGVLKLTANQQDLILDSLNAIKKDVSNSYKRSAQLLGYSK